MKLRSALITLAITLLAAGALGASMAALSWNNPAGGSASIATNWTPNQVPTAADALTYNMAGTYTVTFNSSTTTSTSQTFRQGSVTLNVSSPHTVSGGVTVGDLAGDVATTTLTTGTMTSNAAAVVGDASGATGTLRVNDDDADLLLATTAGVLTVGNAGAGTLTITGGGRVQSADRFLVGAGSTATGAVTVSGTGNLGFPQSWLDIDGTGSTHAIGSSGDATMDVSNGGLATIAGNLNVAQNAGSVSSVTVGGFSIENATELSVGGTLAIGANQSAGTAGGIGTVEVNAGGQLNVGGTLQVAGDINGGTGTLHLSESASITTTSLAVGNGATLDLDGGALNIDGGTFAYTNSAANLLLGGVDGPVVTLKGGGAGTLQDFVGGAALTVGGATGANSADFDVRESSTLTITSGSVVIGESSDDDGGMVINSSTFSMPPTKDLIVGASGVGRFEAEAGADVTGGRAFIGLSTGSDGFMRLDGAGTTADLHSIFVGGGTILAGGAGDLILNAGAECNVSASGLGVKIWPSGALEITGSTLSAFDDVVVDGPATLAGGTINADGFILNSDMTALRRDQRGRQHLRPRGVDHGHRRSHSRGRDERDRVQQRRRPRLRRKQRDGARHQQCSPQQRALERRIPHGSQRRRHLGRGFAEGHRDRQRRHRQLRDDQEHVDPGPDLQGAPHRGRTGHLRRRDHIPQRRRVHRDRDRLRPDLRRHRGDAHAHGPAPDGEDDDDSRLRVGRRRDRRRPHAHAPRRRRRDARRPRHDRRRNHQGDRDYPLDTGQRFW